MIAVKREKTVVVVSNSYLACNELSDAFLNNKYNVIVISEKIINKKI